MKKVKGISFLEILSQSIICVDTLTVIICVDTLTGNWLLLNRSISPELQVKVFNKSLLIDIPVQGAVAARAQEG